MLMDAEIIDPDILPGEVLVGKIEDLSDGQKKCVEFGSESVLLSRIEGKFYATSLKCTHAGAPLDKGILSGERIVCQWHGACFNVKTGDIEEGMVLDPLKTYRVRIASGKIFIRDGQRHILIVGAGSAGTAAAETLRANGYKERITMVGMDNSLPYDLTKCSKMLQKGPLLRNEEYYKQKNIDIRTGETVTVLDATAKTAKLASGEELAYDQCLLCTGGAPRILGLEGENCQNVMTFRNSGDAEKLRSLAGPEKKHVIIGVGILGLEIAAALKTHIKADHVAVIDSGEKHYKLKNLFGPSVFSVIMQLHADNGIVFHKGPAVCLHQEEGKVVSVQVADGATIPCDVLVIAIGIEPRTGFLKGVPLHDDKTVEIDENCRVLGARDLFAAGDMVCFPMGEVLVRVEHWGSAMQQGRVAANNMIGHVQKIQSIPVFWTNHFGKNFRFCGIPAIKSGLKPKPLAFFSLSRFISKPKTTSKDSPGLRPTLVISCVHKEDVSVDSIFCSKMQTVESEEALVVGTVGVSGNFTAYYAIGEMITGVSSFMADPVVAASAELMRKNAMPTLTQLREGANPVQVIETLNSSKKAMV